MTARQLRSLLDRLAASPVPGRDGPWVTRRFVQADASVTLECDDHEALQLADHTFYPYRRTPPAQSAWRVTIRSAIRFRGMPAPFTTARSQQIDPRLRARAMITDDGVAYWIDQHATLIHIDVRNGTVRAYCARSMAPRYWAVRLARHAMSLQLVNVGAAHVQAASCVINDAGVLIAGNQGSGKTTTLLNCVRLLSADFVADDRVLLRRIPRGLVGYPWPMHLKVSLETLRAFPGLADVERAANQDPNRSGHRYIEPPQFWKLLAGGIIADHLQPRLMLWPRLALDQTGAAAPELVPPTTVEQVLLETRLFMDDAGPDGALGPADAVLREPLPHDVPPAGTSGLREVVHALATTVECYRVAVTRESPALASQINMLVRRIQARPHP